MCVKFLIRHGLNVEYPMFLVGKVLVHGNAGISRR